MRTLIVEDDFTNRVLMQEHLKGFGPVLVTCNGKEGVAAMAAALAANEPHDLVCLDVMMPEMDGHQALKQIRALEAKSGRVCRMGAGLVMGRAMHKEVRTIDPRCRESCTRGARILMVTSLHDGVNVMRAYRDLCDGYLVKPVKKEALLEYLHMLELVEGQADG